MLDGPLGGERGNSPFESKMNENRYYSREVGLEALFLHISAQAHCVALWMAPFGLSIGLGDI